MGINELFPWEKKHLRDKIISLLKKLATDPKNSGLMWQIGECYFQIDEVEKGIEYTEKSKKQEEEDFPIFKKNREEVKNKFMKRLLEYQNSKEANIF